MRGDEDWVWINDWAPNPDERTVDDDPGLVEYRLHVGLLTRDKQHEYDPKDILNFLGDWASSTTGQGLDGATIWQGWGYWKGDVEPTLVLSVYETRPSDKARKTTRRLMKELGQAFACFLNQEAVMYVEMGGGGKKLKQPLMVWDMLDCKTRRLGAAG